MSRIGKKPLNMPKGVTASLSGQVLKMKGPKGELTLAVNEEIEPVLDGTVISLKPRNETKRARSIWGMSRTMIANMVDGVTEGYKRELEIQGVGFRAALQGKILQMQLGFSHDIKYEIPAGITVVCPKPTEIVVTGIDKQLVGQVAAKIRKFRPPEPFQGKGVRYKGEYILRKEGKKK